MDRDPFAPLPGVHPLVSRVLFLKRYFDTGYGILSLAKWLLAGVGLASRDVGFTIAFGVAYALLCVVVGYVWHRYGFMKAEVELGNRFNTFVEEMRKAVDSKDI